MEKRLEKGQQEMENFQIRELFICTVWYGMEEDDYFELELKKFYDFLEFLGVSFICDDANEVYEYPSKYLEGFLIPQAKKLSEGLVYDNVRLIFKWQGKLDTPVKIWFELDFTGDEDDKEWTFSFPTKYPIRV